MKFVLSLSLYLFLPFIEVPSLLSFYLPLFSEIFYLPNTKYWICLTQYGEGVAWVMHLESIVCVFP